MPPLISQEEALRLGRDRGPRRDRGADRARLAGARRALRRLDRHVLAGQRQVGRLRRGLRLLRPVALRRGGHADARDDDARADPRARARRRGRRRAPLLHGHPGPGALQARLPERRRGRAAGGRAHEPQALRLDRPHVGRRAPSSSRKPASSASTTTSRRPRATTRRSPRRSATRAGCARSRRSRRPASRPASAASSTSASRPSSAWRWPSSWRRSTRPACRSTCSTRARARSSATASYMDPWEAVKWIAIFRLILPERAVPALRRARREPRRAARAGRQGRASTA